MTPTKQTVYLPVEDYLERQWNEPFEDIVNAKEGYFFTPEQLNEYTQSVIKQALETAADKVEHEEYKFDGKQPPISKKSIVNAFEETFQKYKV